MKIGDSIIMFQKILPDFLRMAVAAVKRPIHKFYLRNFLIQEILKLPFYQIQIPESETFINRGQTVAAPERTSPACLIINNFVLKQAQVLIYKRHKT